MKCQVVMEPVRWAKDHGVLAVDIRATRGVAEITLAVPINGRGVGAVEPGRVGADGWPQTKMELSPGRNLTVIFNDI
ncbi:MAG: hypothetical protein HPY81_10720 [Firmicutes bacterium]|nr:hypothetical protein [Bacillota bacterium]